jgi:hypothetical protein
VRRLSDPFNFAAGVVGPIIAKGLASTRRGMKFSSNYLFFSFNLKFYALMPPIELSRASPVAR